MIAGAYFPLAAAAWGTLYLILRILYHWGYVRSPEARLPFVPIMQNLQFLLPYLAVVSMVFLYGSVEDNYPFLHKNFDPL